MQENKDYAADPSQVSGSDQEDSSSVHLPGSKLRSKLEKLTQWRIDPLLIEFPEDAREFRGGFATVSQGLLATPSPAKGVTNGSEQITVERPGSDAGNSQSERDTHQPGEDHQGKDEGPDGRAAADENDVGHTKGEEKKENKEERQPNTQSPIPEIGYGLTSSKHTVDEGTDPGNHDTQSQSGISKPQDDQQSGDEGPDGRTGLDGDNSQTKEAARKDPENIKDDQNCDRQASEPKIVAVKKLKIEEDTDLERVLGLALRESEFLVEVSHPNIAKFEGFVEDISRHKVWLIFPWEEHGNLRDFLASGEWEIPERISLINDVTMGLEYLHGQEPPIYHGDLKSLNILVNSKFRALITDFGSARHLGDEPARLRKQMKGDGNQPQSAADTTVGEHITLQALFSATASTIALTGNSYTIRWAAPELLQEERPRLRSDVWSLGWIAYEVMTNTIPFQDVKKDAIVIKRVVQGHLPSVYRACSHVVDSSTLLSDGAMLEPRSRQTADGRGVPKVHIFDASTQITDEEGSQLRRGRLLDQLGHMYRRQGDYINAQSCFTEALALYTTNNDSRGRAQGLRYLAEVHRLRNKETEAVKFYSESLELFTALGDDRERADVLFGLAEGYRTRCDYSEAAKLYHESIQIYTSISDEYGRAISLWGLATVHKIQREYSKAINLYREALQFHIYAGDPRERANTLWGLAEVHRELNECGEASMLYSEAARICTDIGDKQGRAINLWGLAEVHRFQHEHDDAIKLYLEAIQMNTDIGNHREKAVALWGLAEAHRARHEYDEATKLYSEAAQIFTDIDDKNWRADVLLRLAQTHQLQDHHSEAMFFYTEASEGLAEIGQSSRASDASEKAASIRKGLESASEGFNRTVQVENETLSTSG